MVHRLHLAVVHGLLDGGTGRSILHCDGVANLRQVLQEDTDLLGQVGDAVSGIAVLVSIRARFVLHGRVVGALASDHGVFTVFIHAELHSDCGWHGSLNYSSV